MEIRKSSIDHGRPFDWGRVSEDYARYRDIYPPVFYRKIAGRGLCVSGQKVLDVGTGTGVLPRNMYGYGAEWTGTDISEDQIRQAEKLSRAAGQRIRYKVAAAEELDFPEGSFDVITACQCFWYFDHKRTAPLFSRLLKEDGRLLFLYMAWLPYEDPVAGASEKLVLRYHPGWTGAGETVHPIAGTAELLEYFEPVFHEEYEVEIPFTRETWHGRMRACRGVGASLSPEDLERWDREHRAMLEGIAPEAFTVRHYAAMAEWKPYRRG